MVDYYPRLMAWCERFVEDRNDAQDILQESFLTLWTKYSEKPQEELPSLIFTIARNRCLDWLKHCKVRDSRFEPLPQIGEERLYNYDFGLAADSGYLYDELQVQIDNVLESLPDKCRQVFILSRFNKMKNREIAELLGISVSMVEKHIRKALAAFSQAIDQSTPLLMILVSIWSMTGGPWE